MMSLIFKLNRTMIISLFFPLLSFYSITTSALEITPIGKFQFISNEAETKVDQPDGLSGIAYISGEKYLAISDRHATVHELSIQLDLDTGDILKASSKPMLFLKNTDGSTNKEMIGPDREGIIYDNENNSLCISNERTGKNVHLPSITCHSIKSGKETKIITPTTNEKLSVFSNIRKNAGFESLSIDNQASIIWTANEGALTIDGDEATKTTGANVRLLQLNKQLQPLKQFVYEVDAIEQSISANSSLVNREFSGLVELLSLPNGELLALERALVGDSLTQPALRIRIYKVNYSNATDIYQTPLLAGLANSTISYKKVNKKLMFEMFNPANFTTVNFEGMTYGPKLSNGDYSLLLIADNNTGLKQTLYSLRLKL